MKIHHILGHETYLYKYKRIEIVQYLQWDHNGIKLEINDGKVAGKFPNVWRLNSTVLINTWVQKETSREIFKSLN